MGRRTYSAEAESFIRENLHLTDQELALGLIAYGMTLSKCAVRKKRQRMGIAKSAVVLREMWLREIGMDADEIAESISDAVDPAEEMSQLRAARRLTGDSA